MDPLTLGCLAFVVGLLLHPLAPGAAWAWASVLAGLLLLALRFGRGVAPALLVAGVLAGRLTPPGPTLRGPIAAIGVRVGAASGRQADVVLERPIAGAFAPGRVRVRFPESPPPPPGAPVLIVGEAGPLLAGIDGAPDPVRAAALSGVTTAVKATRGRRLDGEATDRIAEDLDPTGILRAILLGDTRACRPEDLDVLRKTGTTHILSVSGFHVGVAAWLVHAAGRRALALVALVRPSGAPTLAVDLVAIGAAWAYAGLAGMPVPAQRAALGLTLMALGRAFGRATAGAPALALTAAVLGALDPSSLASASFQLSFGAMVGLVVLAPPLVSRIPEGWPRPVRWLAEAAATTVATTAATLPASAWWFQAIPPLAIPANVVATPLLGLLAMPFAALACWAPWPFDQLGGAVGTLCCRLATFLLGGLVVTPWAPAVGPLGAALLAVAVLLAVHHPRVAAALALGALVPVRLPPADTRVTFLDVGQGDAALVERTDGTRILVDGGAMPTTVVAWLRRNGVRRLDVVAQSHPDRDHAGGLAAVVDALAVGEVWAVEPSPELAAAAERRGVPVNRSPARLWPPEGFAGPTNERSLVFAIDGFLFTGDIGRAVERELADDVGRACVLKVAHHGSAGSSDPALLAAVGPALAVVSVGADNPFGHPTDAALARLRAVAEVARTDLEGTLVVERVPGGVRVSGRGGERVVPCGDAVR